MRIAMWSGPRNLSTAMMYSFAARGDCAIWDEPFYAPYLAKTGHDHPMADQIVAAHDSDPARVAARCSGPVPEEKPHFYMKHMPHHMLPGFPLDWAESCVNVHLIRHPARVIASYAAKRENPTLEDIGFSRQLDLFTTLGGVVIDGDDVRRDPGHMMARLCAEIGLDYRPEMLRWPAGGRPEDGVWAQHWYGAVHASTGFAGAEGALPELDPEGAALCARALPAYEQMRARAIR